MSSVSFYAGSASSASIVPLEPRVAGPVISDTQSPIAPHSLPDASPAIVSVMASSHAADGKASERSLPVSLAGSNFDSAAIRAKIDFKSLRYPFPEGPEAGGDHSFCSISTEGFQVRGPNYLEDRVKVDAGEAMFDLMHTDVFRSEDKIGNVAARRDSWLRAAREAGDTRYYLVVVYVTPAAPYIHLVFYYAVQPERVRARPNFASLWRQFTAHGPEADEFRNERWKVIPRVAEGPWAVSYAVGTKPALLAQKLTHTWVVCDGVADPARPKPVGAVESVGNQDATCGSGAALGYRARGGSFYNNAGPGPYLEADCDVASSSMAFMLVSLLQSSARWVPPFPPTHPPTYLPTLSHPPSLPPPCRYLVIDLCFTIEPREDETLPEAVLGSIRLSRVDVNRPPMLEAESGDWVLGSHGARYGADGAKPDAGEAGEEAGRA